MSKNKKIQVNIYIPVEIRKRLQIIAAKRMLNEPERNFTAAGVAGEFIIKNIELLEKEDGNND